MSEGEGGQKCQKLYDVIYEQPPNVVLLVLATAVTPDRDENVSPTDALIKCEPVPLLYDYHHVEMWDTANPDKGDRTKGGKVQDTYHLDVGEPRWVSNENDKSEHDDYKELQQFHVDGVGDGGEVGHVNWVLEKLFFSVAKVN